jgi:hypothetical protein
MEKDVMGGIGDIIERHGETETSRLRNSECRMESEKEGREDAKGNRQNNSVQFLTDPPEEYDIIIFEGVL